MSCFTSMTASGHKKLKPAGAVACPTMKKLIRKGKNE
jgi:hypothetical protein